MAEQLLELIFLEYFKSNDFLRASLFQLNWRYAFYAFLVSLL